MLRHVSGRRGDLLVGDDALGGVAVGQDDGPVEHERREHAAHQVEPAGAHEQADAVRPARLAGGAPRSRQQVALVQRPGRVEGVRNDETSAAKCAPDDGGAD